MKRLDGNRSFRWLVILAISVLPASALAHAKLVAPTPRDDNDNHKTGPCGGVARTAGRTAYEPGATVPVRWRETIDHAGCFQIAFSPGNDSNWVNLAQIVDDGGTPNTDYDASVTLPPGVTCRDCTLVVRQLMQSSNFCEPDADPNLATNGTYYSCADICVGDCEDLEDAGNGEDAGPGGPVTVPTDGGGKMVQSDAGEEGARPDFGSSDGGCSVVATATSSATFGVAAGLFGLALLRRRRARRG